MKLVALAVLALALVASSARADDIATYEADGTADETSADTEATRRRALDLAFAAAVRLALADLVPPEAAREHKDDLDRQIVGRARIWVASFKVVGQSSDGGRLRITAAVRVDRDKVRAKLGELGITAVAVEAGQVGDVPRPPDSSETPAPTRTATVLLRVTTPRGVLATYGASASREVPVAPEVIQLVGAAGYRIVEPPASGPAARGGADLPLDDASARALAGDVHAEVVVVVGVSLDGTGPVRATQTIGALAKSRVRVLSTGAGARLLGEGDALAGGYGRADAAATSGALVRAAVQAVTQALPPPSPALAPPPPPAPPPPLVAASGEVLVRVTGAAPWNGIAALRQHLADTAGIDRVAIRRLSSAEVVLAVTTRQRSDRIAAAVRAAPDLRARVTSQDAIVEAAVGGAPP